MLSYQKNTLLTSGQSVKLEGRCTKNSDKPVLSNWGQGDPSLIMSHYKGTCYSWRSYTSFDGWWRCSRAKSGNIRSSLGVLFFGVTMAAEGHVTRYVTYK